MLDALRQRGLWEGKARETSQAGRPRALVAERETSLKPCDPMKILAQRWAMGSRFCSGHDISRLAESSSPKTRPRACVSRRRYGTGRRNRAGRPCWRASSLATGAEITTHQTFVEPDGSAKAPLGKQARLFAAGGRTIGGGVWFGVADPDREFIVAEGIEVHALSAMRIFDVTAGCAALSEIGIRRLILPSTARRVRIFADHDELGQGLAAAREAGRRWLAEGRAVAVSMAAHGRRGRQRRLAQKAEISWLTSTSPTASGLYRLFHCTREGRAQSAMLF